MNPFYIFLGGLLTALLAIMINILQSWIKEEPIHLNPKKIFVIMFILILVEIPLTYIQYSVPALPSGLDTTSTDTKSLWNNEGVTLYQLGNYTGALWYYDKAIEMDSSYTIAWTNKGIALMALHRNAEADKAFAKARKEI